MNNKVMQRLRRKSGITLLALVITMVILIILATVTISATIGDNGLIKQAEKTKEIAVNSIAKENEDLNRLEQEYANMMAEDEEIPQPPTDTTPPTVSIQVGEITENSIAITVNAVDNESGLATSGTYKYYLNGAEQKTDTANSHTFTGLKAETQYTIKVEVFDKAGNKGENSVTVSTKLPTPPGGGTTEEGVPIPEGFVYVGGKKNDGVVISDNTDDANKGTDHNIAQKLKGNQFVWVPVEDLGAMFVEETVKLNGVETTTEVYSKLRIRSGDSYTSGKPGDTSSVKEPDVLSDYDTEKQYYSILNYGSTKEMADGFVAEYKAMYESVKKYKGFYIGRYELSGNMNTPTSKAGEVLVEQNWYNLKKACMNIIKGKANTKSTMIYGNQWDETMNWLKKTKFASDPSKVDADSSSWGNYKSTGTGRVEPTGSKGEWRANHIYDLAGNCYEWIQEAHETYSRITRGRGYYLVGL